mgnify:CR=1 FL=1
MPLRDKRQLYREGGLAYGDIKQELYDLLTGKFLEAYQRYKQFMQDTTRVDHILKRGADKARARAQPLLAKIRRNIGIM